MLSEINCVTLVKEQFESQIENRDKNGSDKEYGMKHPYLLACWLWR